MVLTLPPTRFRALPRLWASAVLALFALAVAAGAIFGVAQPQSLRPQIPGAGDGILYERVVARVAAGESFYAATTAEQRAVHGALKPVFAVREPLLAYAMAALPGPEARAWALRLLTMLVLLAWGRRLLREQAPPFAAFALLCLCSGALAGFASEAWVWHEVWAGALMMLALALRRPDRWGTAVLAGLAAALVRELAAPFLLAMAVAALIERRRCEAAGWGAAFLLFVAAMALHAHLLAPFVRPEDAASGGWLALGGWPHILMLLSHWNVLAAAAFVIVPLALLGAAGWPGGLGLRLALVCFGYGFAFAWVGRADNAYWGLMMAPLTALPLAMAPGALADVIGRVWRPKAGL